MKTFKMMIGFALVGLAVTAVGCDAVESPANEAQLSTAEQAMVDAYACKALQPATGQTWVLTGSTEQATREKAAAYCYGKTGMVCVVPRCWPTTMDPESSDIFGDWGCIAQEIIDVGDSNGRTYAKTGADVQAARHAALDYCHQKTARECMILKCFPAN